MDWTDPFFQLRYGVPANEKYKMAIQGQIPGSQVIHSEEDQANEERRAAGYLFGKRWPSIAEGGTKFANAIRFWEPDSIHQTALDSTRAGIAAAQQAQALEARSPAVQPSPSPYQYPSYGR